MSTEKGEDYRDAVREAAMSAETFLKMTLSKKLRDDGTQWVKVVVRPVMVKGKRRIQFSYFDPRRDITKNYPESELKSRLDEALAIPFGQIHVQTSSGDIHVRINRKGHALVSRAKASRAEKEPVLSHDREKAYLLTTEDAGDLLRAVGIANWQDRIRPEMQGKYRQINEFLRIVDQAVPGLAELGRTVRVVDCGCGNAYLTFAAYSYLTRKAGLSVQVTGVDVNSELVERNRRLRDELGWQGLEFVVSSIAEFTPEEAPDMVLSLHACDTATDEAIARGIQWESGVILAAPCCQHELHTQLSSPLFQPVLRHGILKERLADILTDAFRALALRIMGYRTEVIQFVDPEHTAKNLLIRAQKGLKPGHTASVREYKDLKSFWKVTPAIEAMLGEEIGRLL